MEGRCSTKPVAHIYQRTINGFLLFYSVSDFLVFFSIICTVAKKRRITLLGVCPMFDHIHVLAEAFSRKEISGFVWEYTLDYAKAFNTSIGGKGSIFEDCFGCSIKRKEKAIRTTCSYLYNNPVEKKLCGKAPGYRWNFLAYADQRYPFSKPIVRNKASSRIRKAAAAVDWCVQMNKPLNYTLLSSLTDPLDKAERQQLTDYIIYSYSSIDYGRLISFYGSYEKMCLAFESNQGSEYDIKEKYDPDNHLAYIRLGAAVAKMAPDGDIKKILSAPLEKRLSIMRAVRWECKATERQLEKYFRIPPQGVEAISLTIN